MRMDTASAQGVGIRNFCLFWSFTAALLAQSSKNDSLIVPGVRVGPVTPSSTEASLRRVFGNLASKESIGVGEGSEEPGLVLFPSNPRRRLEITWNDSSPPHPAIIFMCRDEYSKTCEWHTVHGISRGTTLRELEKLNGRAFEMVGWGSDVGGNLISFQGGRLEKELRGLALNLFPRADRDGNYLPRLTDQELSAVQGEKFLLSSHPVLQKLNPQVAVLILSLPERPLQ